MEGGGDPTKPKAFCIALHSTVDRYIALYKTECTDFMTRSAQMHKCTNFCRPTGGLIFSHEISSLLHTCSDGFMLPVKEIVTCVYNLNEVDAPFFLLKNGCSTHHGHNSYLATFLIEAPIFEWYVVWCGSKYGYQKDMCSKRIDCVSKI